MERVELGAPSAAYAESARRATDAKAELTGATERVPVVLALTQPLKRPR